MNLLDRIMNKLGYRRTHWTDEFRDTLYELYMNAKFDRGKEILLMDDDYKVTLSVKKMKK